MESSELTILANRRREVLAQRASAMAVVTASDAELAELDIAGRVLARLTHTEWPPVGEPNQRTAQGPVGPSPAEQLHPVTGPTMPQMIMTVMGEAYRQGLRGLTPKDITERIIERFHVEPRPEAVSPIVWRMWKRDQITRTGGGLYSLPEMNEAADLLSREDQSAASDVRPAQGREAGPGGGT